MGGSQGSGSQKSENFAALINTLNQYEQPDSRPEWVGTHYSRILVKTKIAFLDLIPAERTLDNLIRLCENETFKEAALKEPVRSFQHLHEMCHSLFEGIDFNGLEKLVMTDLFLTLAEASSKYAIHFIRQTALFLTTGVSGKEQVDCVKAFEAAAGESRTDGDVRYKLAVLYGGIGWRLSDRRHLRPEPVAEGAGESSQPAAGPSVVAASGSAPVSPAASSSTSAPDLASTSGATPVPAPAPTPAPASSPSP